MFGLGGLVGDSLYHRTNNKPPAKQTMIIAPSIPGELKRVFDPDPLPVLVRGVAVHFGVVAMPEPSSIEHGRGVLVHSGRIANPEPLPAEQGGGVLVHSGRIANPEPLPVKQGTGVGVHSRLVAIPEPAPVEQGGVAVGVVVEVTVAVSVGGGWVKVGLFLCSFSGQAIGRPAASKQPFWADTNAEGKSATTIDVIAAKMTMIRIVFFFMLPQLSLSLMIGI